MAKTASKKNLNKKPKMARCWTCGWYIGRKFLKRCEDLCPNCGVVVEDDWQ